ncbi:putative carbohydrate esterase [Phytophthora cinnamomi]|uniref:putative carbohydrate esterase n=1 Tax=Phytophthora cinnamomi TaxID=4785 RepID=UPI003559762B|nr:putative carbohydrate esterase [Phytophthora cinnamomi]
MATGKRPAAPSEAPQVQHKQQQQPDGLVGFAAENPSEPQEPLLHRMHHPHQQRQSPNGDQAADEDADVDVAVPGEKLLIPKVRTFSLLDAASTSQLGKYLEEEEALHPPLESSGSSSSLRASLLSSSGSAVPRPPHSKNLVLDPESNGAVLQAAVSSGAEVVEVVAEQSWLITKLAVQLIWALRMSKRWILCALRLISFVLLLLPPIVKVAVYWFVDENVHKNIIYGLNRRNLLDVYTVPQTAKDAETALATGKSRSSSVTSASSASFTEARRGVHSWVGCWRRWA